MNPIITAKTSGSLSRIFANGRHIGTVEIVGKQFRWTVSALYSPAKVRAGFTGTYRSAKDAIVKRATVNL